MPFVQIARIDTTDFSLLENINIFDPDSATAYGALATNANDEVGISYALGGGTRHPSHIAGILSGTRRDALIAAGQRSPLPDSSGHGEWGDFLSIRPVFPERRLFVATGYTMKGAGSGSGTNRDVTPRLAVFGRSGDAAPAGQAGDGGAVGDGSGDAGASTGGGGGPTGGGPPDGGAMVAGTGPIQDVDTLPMVSAAVAAKIKAAAGIQLGTAPPQSSAQVGLELATKPGVERWPVKTGTDDDVALVGKNIVNGHDLGAGIVEATVEELITVPRPADMPDPALLYAPYQKHRAAPVETTIWSIDATIRAMKLEADGDYHLVLQGASGETMIAEVPTATKVFVGNSPWLKNITAARQAVYDRLVSHLQPADFVPLGKMLVPRGARLDEPPTPPLPAAFPRADEGNGGIMLLFKTAIPPTKVRVVGVGFFDKVHGQMGVSQSNGIELHPVLRIEWR
jgi:hypothetical protein